MHQPDTHPTALPVITIVSGLPRSGTSMMMQVLAAGGMSVLTDSVRQADVDNPRGYFELEAAKGPRRDSSWLADAVGKAVKLVHLLLSDLPPQYSYRVLLMERNLHEIVASQYRMLERHGKRGAALAPERLAEILQQQLQSVQYWLIQQPNFDVLSIPYIQMVLNTRSQAEAINNFLAGSLNVDRMVSAVEPSLYRQRADISADW